VKNLALHLETISMYKAKSFKKESKENGLIQLESLLDLSTLNNGWGCLTARLSNRLRKTRIFSTFIGLPEF